MCKINDFNLDLSKILLYGRENVKGSTNTSSTDMSITMEQIYWKQIVVASAMINDNNLHNSGIITCQSYLSLSTE